MIDQGIGVAEPNNADLLMGRNINDILGLVGLTKPYGGALTNDPTDPVNDIAFAPVITRDSTNTVTIVAPTGMVKQLDVAWAPGPALAGGRMSAAAVANTTYFCFVIYDPTNDVYDFGLDSSPTAPTLPANYVYFRNIGSVLRVGGALLAFVQDGDYFALSTPITDVNVTNPGVAAVLRALSVPVGKRVKAKIFVAFQTTALGDMPGGILITDPSCVDVAPTLTLATVVVDDNVTKLRAGGAMAEVWTNTAGQIRSRVQASAGGTILRVSTFGWTDPFN